MSRTSNVIQFPGATATETVSQVKGANESIKLAVALHGLERAVGLEETWLRLDRLVKHYQERIDKGKNHAE